MRVIGNSIIIDIIIYLSLIILFSSTAYRHSIVLAGRQTVTDNLYRCGLNYLQMNTSMIRYSMNYLLVLGPDQLDGRLAENEIEILKDPSGRDMGGFSLNKISVNATHDNIKSSGMNPERPFVFLINGFNSFNQGKSIGQCVTVNSGTK